MRKSHTRLNMYMLCDSLSTVIGRYKHQHFPLEVQQPSEEGKEGEGEEEAA